MSSQHESSLSKENVGPANVTAPAAEKSLITENKLRVSVHLEDDGDSVIFEKGENGMLKITKNLTAETVDVVSEPLDFTPVQKTVMQVWLVMNAMKNTINSCQSI